jgi:hypothetical protein
MNRCVWCKGPLDQPSPNLPDICMSCHAVSEDLAEARACRDAEHAVWLAKIRKHPAYRAEIERSREHERTQAPMMKAAE